MPAKGHCLGTRDYLVDHLIAPSIPAADGLDGLVEFLILQKRFIRVRSRCKKPRQEAQSELEPDVSDAIGVPFFKVNQFLGCFLWSNIGWTGPREHRELLAVPLDQEISDCDAFEK